MRALRKITQGPFTRDWRVKTLVPVILVNVIAFAGLYVLMYHFAVSNLIQTYKRSATVIFDELQLNFEDMMLAHSLSTAGTRLSRHAEAHGLSALSIYDPEGQPVATSGAQLTAGEAAQAREALHTSSMLWTLGPNNVVIFGRTIENAPVCHSCHDARLPRLGVMQLGIDLTKPLEQARTNVRQKFALAGVAWLGVLALLFWTARIVIGRPLALIQKSIGDPSRREQSGDLEDLAQRVHHRVWDLIDGQKKREETIAKQLVRAKQLAALGELAAGLTHEIKNPVAGVMSALELLRSEGDATAVQNAEVYEQILSELRRVTGTLDSLLRLARPQAPQRVGVDMARVVRELTSLFSARLRRQGVTLEVEAVESLPILELDPAQMAQVVVNLLTNSMQATDRNGSVRVSIASFPRRDGVVLVVSDSGRGVSAEQLERVFDPFFTTREDGTGLGLAICRQIVEQHGGTITLESEPGKGTRVVVLLPDLKAKAKEEKVKEKVRDVAVAAG
ncbi:MAG: sensor histidine kinase [Thermoanaerobaculia bacterium]